MKKARLIIDILMMLFLVLLMAYSLIGETLHEVFGTLIFVLFIVHHILNRKWTSAVFKGKYNPARIFQTLISALLFIIMILQPVSGIVLSKHLFTFLPSLHITSQARTVHMLFAYWGFVLMSIHAGTHLAAMLNKLKKHKKGVRITAYIFIVLWAAYGCYAFVKRGLPKYMFMRSMFVFFDYSEPRAYFFFDYISVAVLFMMIGLLIVKGFLGISAKKNKSSNKENR